jgi:hypothetical protein
MMYGSITHQTSTIWVPMRLMIKFSGTSPAAIARPSPSQKKAELLGAVTENAWQSGEALPVRWSRQATEEPIPIAAHLRRSPGTGYL